MGLEEGKPAIAVEKGAAAATMLKPEAGAEDSSMAPSQFTIPVATAPNH